MTLQALKKINVQSLLKTSLTKYNIKRYSTSSKLKYFKISVSVHKFKNLDQSVRMFLFEQDEKRSTAAF